MFFDELFGTERRGDLPTFSPGVVIHKGKNAKLAAPTKQS